MLPAPIWVYTPMAHLPSFCHKFHPHHSHSNFISQTCCLQCVSGLQHASLAQCTLPGPSEASQASEAVFWGPANVRCYLQQHRVGGDGMSKSVHVLPEHVVLRILAGWCAVICVAVTAVLLQLHSTWSMRLAIVVASASKDSLTGLRQSVVVLVVSFQ
jgi:hypothetical protein